MYNKVESEQCFPATSAKSMTIFQACLKLVREEAGVQLSNRDSKHLTSMDQPIHEGGMQ